MTLGKKLRRAKADAVEWLLLSALHPLQAALGPAREAALEALHGKKKVLLTLVPIHGNLGDQAIAHATRAYLAAHFADHEVLEVDIVDIYRRAKALRNALGPDDIVFLLGGGNTGDLYRNEEWTRRFVLRTFRRQRVVSLPQTIHFTSTARGRRELRRSAAAYRRHPRFLYISRDPSTLSTVQSEMPGVRTFQQPDMVPFLDERSPARERRGITVCLRQDREGALGARERTAIFERIRERFGPHQTFDTIAPRNVSPATRAAELGAVWEHLRGAQVAVTDRLHGMFFCLVTGTPCVVIRSFDRKVIEAYGSIHGKQNFIFLVEDPSPENVVAAIERARAVEDPRADDLKRDFFDGLRSRMLGALGV